MAENASGAEKTEQATPRKLSQAREEGQVAYSPDFTVAVMLIASFSILMVAGPWFVGASQAMLRWTLNSGLSFELTDSESLRIMLLHHLPLLGWLLVVSGVLVALDLALCVGQVGFAPSLKPLMPKLTKINPISGFQRLFGMRGLVKTLFSTLKLALVSLLAWWLIADHLHSISIIPADVARRMADETPAMMWIGIKLASILFVLGLGDLLFQRWQHERDMMMTKQEVKEEMKQSEGDPLVRGRIRQLQRKLAMARMMQEVPKASVVITNPTHVAVALRYDPGAMEAPVVVAKGYDEVAQRIKAIAAAHQVPMIEDVQLARALAREVQLGQAIRPKWYQAVAEVLALVQRIRQRTGQAPPIAQPPRQ